MSYMATIRHHSIARAREIAINGNLKTAKRRASAEFGQERRDFHIHIYIVEDECLPELVAWRRVSERRWREV